MHSHALFNTALWELGKDRRFRKGFEKERERDRGGRERGRKGEREREREREREGERERERGRGREGGGEREGESLAPFRRYLLKKAWHTSLLTWYATISSIMSGGSGPLTSARPKARGRVKGTSVWKR